MLTVTNVIAQVDVLETVLRSVLEAKPGSEPSESEEGKEVKQKSEYAESEETEQLKIPKYYSRFKVGNFLLSKYSKL